MLTYHLKVVQISSVSLVFRRLLNKFILVVVAILVNSSVILEKNAD
jgi:hypothetical protein